MFTVFTPAYNRAHTISRVFDSLRSQTMRDFEWIVVDDGSTDDTEGVVARLMASADFRSRYIRQSHQGKHVAHNLAVREARGTLFAPLDSDDALMPDALQKICEAWEAIPPSERKSFSGIGGLCCDQKGTIVGDLYPHNSFDSNWCEIVYVHRVKGEKWGVTRTDILREYPFPEVADTPFVPEGMIGLQIARKYRERYINHVLRVYYRDEGRADLNWSSRQSAIASAPGRLYYYVWLLNSDMDYFWRSPIPFLKAAGMLPVVARHSGRSLADTLAELTDYRSKLLVISLYPCGIFLTLLDGGRTLLRRLACRLARSKS